MQANGIDRISHGTGSVRAFTGSAQDQPPSRGLERPDEQRCQSDSDEKQNVDLQHVAQLRDVGPKPKMDRRKKRSTRSDQRLAEKECRAGAEQQEGDTDRNVIDARQSAD